MSDYTPGEKHIIALVSAVAHSVLNLEGKFMSALDQLQTGLDEVKDGLVKVLGEVTNARATLVTLEATIVELETQLANAGIPQAALDKLASIKSLVKQIDSELPDQPAG